MNKIENYMTKEPITINSHQTLEYAIEAMREYSVRHLPVLEQGRVVGVISERDIRFVDSFESLSLKELLVSDAFSDDLVTFLPTTDIKEVCQRMAQEKIGSVVINDSEGLKGIFTWIDALNYISK